MIHIAWWRIRIPKREVLSILIIFSAVILTGLSAILYFTDIIVGDNQSLVSSIIHISHISFFYIIMMTIYIVIYTGLEDESPSLFLLLQILNSGKDGIEISKLYKSITNDTFIGPRIKFLIEEEMASVKDSRIIILSKGQKFLNVFRFIQNTLKLSKISG